MTTATIYFEDFVLNSSRKTTGRTITETDIVRFVAGINFQLRYAPFIMEARKMIDSGIIGDLCGIEINVNIKTPGDWWDFIVKSQRTEILYHNIHYVDLVRSFFGNPHGILAKTTLHPNMANIAAVRSNIIKDCGDVIRANILTNHCHDFGNRHQHAYIKFEGTKGAIRVNIGLLMDYPKGESDTFEYVTKDSQVWQTVNVDGTWFPHAFIGSMAQIMRAATGEITTPDNSVEDCIYTMACVEAAYTSNAKGSTKLPV